MDKKDRNGFHRSLQAKGNCNTLWPRRQDGKLTIWLFDSYHHCMNTTALLWTYSISQSPKVKCNYKANPPMKKFENQVTYLKKMQLVLVGKLLKIGNWKEETPPAMVNLTLSA
ncbi:4536_t:CDS:2 [Funneliformis caledonium]|uniref:4536_t:CDS:1 n=1 Tax=Funneliformis caledonium TaxID=1117310 RepID=A0A9N9GZZ2_9GLOM|nr:4536_t:CDS:2 [Funneliformis caledonium]